MIVTIKTGIEIRVPGIYLNDRLIGGGFTIPPGTIAKFRSENRPSLVPVLTSVTFMGEGEPAVLDVGPKDLETMILKGSVISVKGE